MIRNENICKEIKKEIPNIHIHGFSPEEVLYGASRSKTIIREYLKRLKESGVDTLPGTAAEILDQKLRDIILIQIFNLSFKVLVEKFKRAFI